MLSMGGASRMELEPKEAAQLEAEVTFNGFIRWTKIIVGWSIFFLLVVGAVRWVSLRSPALSWQVRGTQVLD